MEGQAIIGAETVNRSRVFRDMIKDSTTSRIELSDREMEDEDVFGYFLDVIKGDPIDTTDIYDIPILTKAIRLAQKYACDTALERISLRCQVDMYEKKCRPLLPLMVGFALNDMKLCVKALSTPGGRWKPEEWLGEFGDSAEFGLVMDPTALPLEISQIVKPGTMWTWTRAFRLVYHQDEGAKEKIHWIREENEETCEQLGCDFEALANLESGGEFSSHLVERHQPTESLGPPYTLSL